MPEYIDRDKTIEEFKTCGAVFTYGVDVCNGVISRLLIQPAADVAPVVHGKWVYKEKHRCGIKLMTGTDAYGNEHTIKVDRRRVVSDPYCSVCGKLNEAVFLNYCPNCGAKMDNQK